MTVFLGRKPVFDEWRFSQFGEDRRVFVGFNIERLELLAPPVVVLDRYGLTCAVPSFLHRLHDTLDRLGCTVEYFDSP